MAGITIVHPTMAGIPDLRESRVITQLSNDAIWNTLAIHIRQLLSGADGGRSGSTAHMCFASSGEPVANLNYAALWGEASEEDVDNLMEHLVDLDAMVVVAEASADRLGTKLKESGLVLGGACPMMAIAPIPAGSVERQFRIEAVRQPQQLGVMVEVMADAYSLDIDHMSASFGTALLAQPDTTPFLAWREGKAESAVIATRVGTNVGIWVMGTRPSAQRRGAGHALLETVMSTCAAEGAEGCFLFPSPAGRRLYDALGFVEVDRSEIWLKGLSTEFPERR